MNARVAPARRPRHAAQAAGETSSGPPACGLADGAQGPGAPRRLRRLSRWRLTWTAISSAHRLIECTISREASCARSVTPLRCSVTSATWQSAIAGLRSSIELDLELGQLGHLLGHLAEALLDVLPHVIRDGDVSTLDLDPHRSTS